ncbi:MAG: AI-2E family transporter [Candidatus Binatia bacterium]
MSRENLFAAFFFAAFAFLLYQLGLFLAPFFTPLMWAAILALTFYPLTTRLTRLFRGQRTTASLVLVMLVIAVVVLPAIYLGSLVVTQTAAAYQRVHDLATTGQLTRLVDEARASRLGLFWQTLTAPLQGKVELDPASLILSATNWISQQILGSTTALAKNALVTLMNFVLLLVALFFFFRDGERMATLVGDLVPMLPDHKTVVFRRLYDTLTAVVQSMVLTAVAQGTLAGLGYWLLTDIPFALFLGFLTGLASFLPLAGPALVWSSVAVYLALSGFRGQALAIAIWGVFPVSTVDNLIKPLFIGGRVRLPTFLLLFALVGGISVYGFLGVFLGPVILAILLAFTDIYRELYAGPPSGTDPQASP